MIPLFLLCLTKHLFTFPKPMVSSICFTTFLLISIFFFSEAAIDEVLVPPKYDGLLSSARISSEVKKEVGVSSIVEARELIISRKMKVIARKTLDGGDVSDRNYVEGDRKLEASGSQREKKMVVRDDDHHLHGVGHNLEMRSRGGAKRRSRRGFVAFSADYHIPKPHPPRNN